MNFSKHVEVTKGLMNSDDNELVIKILGNIENGVGKRRI